jgi:subtilase family serine protease
MRFVKSLLPVVSTLFSVLLISSLSFAAVSDRITGPIDSSQKVALYGNMHGLARPQSDLGRADGSRQIDGISLNFHLSAAQQKDLNQFLAQLGNPKSPHFHKYLTIPQYAARFGMSQNDLDKVVAWVQSQGFTNIKIAPSHNKVSFDGTVAQIESAFALEMHNYLVDGVVHTANAMNPSVPAALSGAVQYVGHLHDFAPKPRLQVKPNLTSYVSGNHFLSPADFATIYDLNPLYTAGNTGSNQKIVIVGQTTITTTDLDNFRSAAGLPASTPTLTLMEGTGARCSGDEGESDLDVEWSGGVAKDASITFLYAGLGTGDTCSNRFDSVWDALEEALTGTLTQGVTGTPIAPFVSTSYGYCESGLGEAFAGPYTGTLNFGVLEQWEQEGQALGVTLISASGDSGAADCDPSSSTSATGGFAVDSPAAIPETTGAGGNEFFGDAAGTVTGNTAAGDPPYWGPSNAGSDSISSALEYIPEEAWNDSLANIAAGGGLGASGGGASIYFSKPSWQTGTGVPNDGKRDVPDISITASADHDGYLFCSEDGPNNTVVSTCTSGFRTGAGGDFTIVGGTSAAAPTFTAILALVNQYLGNVPPTGLAPDVNLTLYQLPGNNPAPFHDVTTGNNIVPCTAPSTNCPTGTTQFGFNAGIGYDQVTGLGSVDGYALAEIWARTPTTTTISAPGTVNLGASVTFTATITPSTATGTVSFYNNGSSAALGSGNISGGTATFTTTTLPLGSNNVSASYGGDASDRVSTSATPAVTSVTSSFSLTSSLNGGTLTVGQGQTSGPVTLTVTSSTGFVVTSGSSSTTLLPVTYSCSGLPSEAQCNFAPNATTSATSVTVTIKTAAPTAELVRPNSNTRIFYAALLPGLFGIMFTMGSRKRKSSLRGLRFLSLIVALGFSTLWLSSCGGSSSGGNSNPGTPQGTSTVVINATTGGSSPITATSSVTLTVN